MKIIRKWLFSRTISVPSIAHFSGKREYNQLVAVEGFTLDHAVRRLMEKWPDSQGLDWNMMEELDPEHFVGTLGIDLPLFPNLRGKS